MTGRPAPSVAAQPDSALALDEAFARFCGLKRTQPVADLLGAKVLDCILVAATECEVKHKRYAALAFPIKNLAQRGNGFGAPNTHGAHGIENCLGRGKSMPDRPVVPDVDEEKGIETAHGFLFLGKLLSIAFEAKDHARIKCRTLAIGRHNRADTDWCIFQFGLILAREVKEVSSEVFERELREGHALLLVFEIENFVLQAQQLLVAPLEIGLSCILGIGEDVVFAGRGEVN